MHDILNLKTLNSNLINDIHVPIYASQSHQATQQILMSIFSHVKYLFLLLMNIELASKSSGIAFFFF